MVHYMKSNSKYILGFSGTEMHTESGFGPVVFEDVDADFDVYIDSAFLFRRRAPRADAEVNECTSSICKQIVAESHNRGSRGEMGIA